MRYHFIMSKRDKLILKIFNADADVKPNEAVKLLEKLGFKAMPTGSSHLTFRKANSQSITVVLTQNPLKLYMLKKLQEVLINEGYKND
jgi:predicted RNA binding protein YcfA (HicA-like mRNA interferase family)